MHRSKYEFEFALQRKGVRTMIPVVMEPSCLDTSTWTSVVCGKLGGKLYVNLSKASTQEDMQKGVAEIIQALKKVGVVPGFEAQGHRPTQALPDAAAPSVEGV